MAPRPSAPRCRQRGITLVEALVALAVMAFGIMGIIGVQATLRATGDLGKQRAEAVRIAQARIETVRSFSVITPPLVPDGSRAYDNISTTPFANVAGLSTNTTFSLSTTATDLFNAPDALRAKAVTATVTWPDRAGVQQGVALRTLIAGVPPGVAGSLTAPGRTAVANGSRGRHPFIPANAADQTGGDTSSFEPPGGGGVRWVFDNTTGFITATCTSVDPSSCTPLSARLLSGFVRFATGATAPTPADAELPPSGSEPVQVSVDQILPTPAATVQCYESQTSAYVAYFCALPVTSDGNPRWSGRSLVSGLVLSASIADPDATVFRVCRYTPHREQRVVGTTPPMSNAEHPLDYVDVTGGLINQNFLVIRGGDGSNAFDCPDDDPGTEFINGTTWHHQPSA
jgi:Tfp pilus assembly protein PilV